MVDGEVVRLSCVQVSGTCGASLNFRLNALRRNPAAALHFACDPEYGGPRCEKYSEWNSVFLSGANCPSGDIRYSDP